MAGLGSADRLTPLSPNDITGFPFLHGWSRLTLDQAIGILVLDLSNMLAVHLGIILALFFDLAANSPDFVCPPLAGDKHYQDRRIIPEELAGRLHNSVFRSNLQP